jgi:hypothetical protein
VSTLFEFVQDDNGWSPHVGSMAVNEVPGTHDSMVLEPNVRVLAAKLRVCLVNAENEIASRDSAAGHSALPASAAISPSKVPLAA